MSDYLVRASSNSTVRNVIKTLGLPTPTELARDEGAYQERFLDNEKILTGATANAGVIETIGTTLEEGASKIKNHSPG